MSMNKAIKYGKEHRKQYYGAEAIDKSCRCHGGCEYCKGNRFHKYKIEEDKMNYREKEGI